MRSYIGRRSARHGTSATRRSSTSSAPTTKLRRTSTHAPRVRVVRSALSSERTPGDVVTAPPKRLLWKSMSAVYAEIEQMFEKKRRRLDGQTWCWMGEVSPAQQQFHRPTGETRSDSGALRGDPGG